MRHRAESAKRRQVPTYHSWCRSGLVVEWDESNLSRAEPRAPAGAASRSTCRVRLQPHRLTSRGQIPSSVAIACITSAAPVLSHAWAERTRGILKSRAVRRTRPARRSRQIPNRMCRSAGSGQGSRHTRRPLSGSPSVSTRSARQWRTVVAARFRVRFDLPDVNRLAGAVEQHRPERAVTRRNRDAAGCGRTRTRLRLGSPSARWSSSKPAAGARSSLPAVSAARGCGDRAGRGATPTQRHECWRAEDPC